MLKSMLAAYVSSSASPSLAAMFPMTVPVGCSLNELALKSNTTVSSANVGRVFRDVNRDGGAAAVGDTVKGTNCECIVAYVTCSRLIGYAAIAAERQRAVADVCRVQDSRQRVQIAIGELESTFPENSVEPESCKIEKLALPAVGALFGHVDRYGRVCSSGCCMRRCK